MFALIESRIHILQHNHRVRGNLSHQLEQLAVI